MENHQQKQYEGFRFAHLVSEDSQISAPGVVTFFSKHVKTPEVALHEPNDLHFLSFLRSHLGKIDESGFDRLYRYNGSCFL